MSQISQAEADKFFIEKFRMGKGHTSGIIWWNIMDNWPQFSDAVVDLSLIHILYRIDDLIPMAEGQGNIVQVLLTSPSRVPDPAVRHMKVEDPGRKPECLLRCRKYAVATAPLHRNAILLAVIPPNGDGIPQARLHRLRLRIQAIYCYVVISPMSSRQAKYLK